MQMHMYEVSTTYRWPGDLGRQNDSCNGPMRDRQSSGNIIKLYQVKKTIYRYALLLLERIHSYVDWYPLCFVVDKYFD